MRIGRFLPRRVFLTRQSALENAPRGRLSVVGSALRDFPHEGPGKSVLLFSCGHGLPFAKRLTVERYDRACESLTLRLDEASVAARSGQTPQAAPCARRRGCGQPAVTTCYVVGFF